MRDRLKLVVLAFVLGVGVSVAVNDPPPEHGDAQEDEADNGWCFTITLDENAPDGFIYREFRCEEEEEQEKEQPTKI